MRKQLCILIPLLLLLACESEPDLSNPIFDNSPDVQGPETTILTHDAVFDTSTITLSWEGNEYVNGYSYRLEPLSYQDADIETYMGSSWSELSSATSVTLEYLDEGIYKFYVEGRFNIDHTDTAFTTFEVNAINGPALRMYPLNQTVTLEGQFDIYLFAEEINDVAGIEAELDYNSNFITYDNYVIGSAISDYADLTIFPPPTSDPNGGNILISGVVAGNGLSGTGAIMKLTFTFSGSDPSTTTIDIDPSNTLLRDIDNYDITIEKMVSGSVEVSE